MKSLLFVAVAISLSACGSMPTQPTQSVPLEVVAASPLDVAPALALVPVNYTICFTAKGGTGTYDWSLMMGNGTLSKYGSVACYSTPFAEQFSILVTSGSEKTTVGGRTYATKDGSLSAVLDDPLIL